MVRHESTAAAARARCSTTTPAYERLQQLAATARESGAARDRSPMVNLPPSRPALLLSPHRPAINTPRATSENYELVVVVKVGAVPRSCEWFRFLKRSSFLKLTHEIDYPVGCTFGVLRLQNPRQTSRDDVSLWHLVNEALRESLRLFQVPTLSKHIQVQLGWTNGILRSGIYGPRPFYTCQAFGLSPWSQIP
jgi:hypothetical protein